MNNTLKVGRTPLINLDIDGISTADNVLASVRYGKEFGVTNILTILCDRGERYLSML
jgi:cysteine synthase